jgi:UDP-2-acetamido-2-deoxy-ribo-hexuluronate aminotransferase
MQDIQMVDLKTQYKNIKPEVDAAIEAIINDAAFINGKPVQEFATQLQQYLNIKQVIPCANGTDALQIAMMGLGLQPGDEVITPSFTYIATVEVMALLHLKPVFVDVDKELFTINPALIEAAITPKTKAIVPVHLYGQCADMAPILEIAQKHNLYVIEDNAQAIGGSYTYPNQGPTVKTGTMGHIGCTSFFPSKNLGCYGDGGALFTNNEPLADTLRMIANHGQKTRYYHDIVGCNSRLDTIQAAVLKIKLPHLDTYCTARQQVAHTYNTAFANHPHLSTPATVAYSQHVYHQYTLTLHTPAHRDKLQQYLQHHQVPSMIYYPVPAHKQKMFETFGSASTHLPITDWLTERVISLPIHTEMQAAQQQYIIDTVLNFFKQV